MSTKTTAVEEFLQATGSVESVEPVRRSVRVRANAERAYGVFTKEMDSWWPRSHHIGNSPLKQVVVEGRAGGAVYSEQEDGAMCPWASVLVWDPPHRFVMAWQVSPEWKYEPDLKKCSQVEIRFTPADDGTTLVELEHREFHRHGGEFARMRDQVNAEGGWGSLLELFAKKVEQE